MPKIIENELKNQIKQETFDKLYFIFGEEKFLVKHYSKTITQKIVRDDFSSFNFHDIDGRNLDIDQLADAVYSVPFMSSHKCVRLFNLDIEKLNEKDVKKLKDLISNLEDYTTLLISQTNIEINLKKSSKWKSFIKFLEKHGSIVELEKLNRSQISKLLIAWAKKRNASLSLNQAYKIIDMCGEDLTSLQTELEKVCALTGENEVKDSDIERVVVANIQANIFALNKLIIARDADNAYKQLNILFEKKEEPIAILSVLSSAYIDIYRVKTAIDSGSNYRDLSKNFDYKGREFKLDIAFKDGKNLSMQQIRLCLDEILKADLKLKSSRLDNKIILETLIANMLYIISAK